MNFNMSMRSFSEVMSSFGGVRFASRVLKQILIAALSCLFAVVGAFVGCITGAAVGQTSETGFLRGCGVGIISGSLVALELVESIANHNFLSKVGLSDGEFLADWLTQVLMKAYEFQVMGDLPDIFDAEPGTKGLSVEHIRNLSEFKVHSKSNQCDEDDTVSCPICLEDLREGECGRRFSGCGHEYHLQCIDAWLVRSGSCPVCRQNIAL